MLIGVTVSLWTAKNVTSWHLPFWESDSMQKSRNSDSDSHVIQGVTRSDDTWMQDNGHFLSTSRERERALRSCRVEEKTSDDSRRPSWGARSSATTTYIHLEEGFKAPLGFQTLVLLS